MTLKVITKQTNFWGRKVTRIFQGFVAIHEIFLLTVHYVLYFKWCHMTFLQSRIKHYCVVCCFSLVSQDCSALREFRIRSAPSASLGSTCSTCFTTYCTTCQLTSDVQATFQSITKVTVSRPQGDSFSRKTGHLAATTESTLLSILLHRWEGPDGQ